MGLFNYKCRECNKITEKISTSYKGTIWCEHCGGIADRVFCADGGSFRKGKGYWVDKKQGDN